MRGGSLTRFRTDEWYDQHGKGLMTDLLRGGFQGLKSTRNPLKLPSNIKRGLETGFTRGVKWKAEDVIKKEITKRAKKALSQERERSCACGQCFVSQTNQTCARYFWSVNMEPVHSRPRRIRSDRGLSQWGGLFPFWKLMRRQRGGWLSPEVMRVPRFDLRQRLA